MQIQKQSGGSRHACQPSRRGDGTGWPAKEGRKDHSTKPHILIRAKPNKLTGLEAFDDVTNRPDMHEIAKPCTTTDDLTIKLSIVIGAVTDHKTTHAVMHNGRDQIQHAVVRT